MIIKRFKKVWVLVWLSIFFDCLISEGLLLGADSAILDCEDGVAANRKQEARENIRDLLRDNKFDFSKISVRINSVQSNMALDDLKCIFQSENKPKCIFVPKTDEIDQIKWLYENIHNLSNDCKINLFFYMESSTSLLNLKEIISNAINLSKVKYNSQFELEGTSWVFMETFNLNSKW